MRITPDWKGKSLIIETRRMKFEFKIIQFHESHDVLHLYFDKDANIKVCEPGYIQIIKQPNDEVKP